MFSTPVRSVPPSGTTSIRIGWRAMRKRLPAKLGVAGRVGDGSFQRQFQHALLVERVRAQLRQLELEGEIAGRVGLAGQLAHEEALVAGGRVCAQPVAQQAQLHRRVWPPACQRSSPR